MDRGAGQRDRETPVARTDNSNPPWAHFASAALLEKSGGELPTDVPFGVLKASFSMETIREVAKVGDKEIIFETGKLAIGEV